LDSSAGRHGDAGHQGDRKSSSTSQSSATYALDGHSPRKLSAASVASFASSFQDYCRKLSNSSVGAASTGGDQASPTVMPATDVPHSSTDNAAALNNAAGLTAVRKFSDPNDYGHWRRTEAAGGGGKAPLFFELDRSGAMRRLASTSLERYRPYMSRLSAAAECVA